MNQIKIKKGNRGGARPGAGRPSGSKDKVSRDTVREIIVQSTGQTYEEILIEDFIKARQTNDGLTYKYHNLIAGKLIPTLNEVDVTSEDDQVMARQTAFAEAIAKIAGISVNLGSADSDK